MDTRYSAHLVILLILALLASSLVVVFLSTPVDAQSGFSLSTSTVTGGQRLDITGPFTANGNRITLQGPTTWRISLLSPRGTSVQFAVPRTLPAGSYTVTVSTAASQNATAGTLTITSQATTLSTPTVTNPIQTVSPPTPANNQVSAVAAADTTAVHITDIVPNPAYPRAGLVVTGSGFTTYGNQLTITGNGYTERQSVVSPDGRTIRFILSRKAPTGILTLYVTNRNGVTSAAAAMTVGAAATPIPAPSSTPRPTPFPVPSTTVGPQPTPSVSPAQSELTISSLTPNPGHPNDTVVITGTNFPASGNTLHLTGETTTHRASLLATNGGTQIRFVIPHNLPTGQYSVQIITRDGRTSTIVPFTIASRPDSPVLPRPCLFDAILCPDTHTYVALGDSVAVGLTALRGYVYRYGDNIEDTINGVNINYNNRARIGATSTDLLNVVRNDSTVRQEVTNADIVTWNVGGNDLRAMRDSYKQRSCGGGDNQDCLRTGVATLKSNFTNITAEITTLRQTTPGITRTMDQYYPYVRADLAIDTWPGDGGSNDLDVLLPYVREYNSHIAVTASANGVPLAQVFTAFNGSSGVSDPDQIGLISSDGFHPNDAGHKVIADLVSQFGYAGLRPVPVGTPNPRPFPTLPPLPPLPRPPLPQPCPNQDGLGPLPTLGPIPTLPPFPNPCPNFPRPTFRPIIPLPRPCITCSEIPVSGTEQ